MMTVANTDTCLLTWIIFAPLIFSGLMALLPSSCEKWARPLALLSSVVSFGLALVLWCSFNAEEVNYQFVQRLPWLQDFGISYFVGVDGISLPLVMLTAFITPVALLGTWYSGADATPLKNEKYFMCMVGALQTGMYGTFMALDLFLFYFFWEVVLIPMFFLIGVWGGKERLYATMKFFLYTMVGSLLMLVAILWLIYKSKMITGLPTAALPELLKLIETNPTVFVFDASSCWNAFTSPVGLLFWAFTLAFVIKVPMVPFHTWLPDAHVQAPTAGSVFLAAVMLKLGTYGLMRLALPLFPAAAHYFAPALMALGLVGIVYGALCALGQSDFKKLVAYSSVSHMGYIVVGLFSFNKLALAGSLYQMINHGVSSAGLFLVVGFLYERLHTRDLNDFGGLAKKVPVMAIAFMVMTLSSVALPGSNGFVGEFPILLGTFQGHPWIALLAGTGVILGAVYALKAYQMVMLGPGKGEIESSAGGGLRPGHGGHGHGHDDHAHGHDHQSPKAEAHDAHPVRDLSGRELLSMVLLTFLVFGIGFFPRSFFGKSEVTLGHYAEKLIERVR